MTTKNGKSSNGNGLHPLRRKLDQVPCYVKRDSLKPAPWNPPIRVQLSYLRALRESMSNDGFWSFAPILVDRNGTIIDGHRRWTVAGLLHIEEVPVVIVDEDAQVIWAQFNDTHMALSGAQVMQAVANGLNARPARHAAMLARLEEVVGKEGIQYLSEANKSPYIINQAIRIATYCGLEDDNPFIGLVVYWLVEHRKMNQIVSQAIKENIDPSLVERRIRSNRPLTLEYA